MEIAILPHYGQHTHSEHHIQIFHSNIKTKAELTEYLAVKCIAYSKSPVSKLKKFLVTSGTETKGIEVFQMFYSHTVKKRRILHSLMVDMDAELVIDSQDTDVLF